MLTQITLERFKCFNRLYMPLKPLTLIAGTNGAGKSSIIQALLLLRQSCKDKDYDWKQSLVINGGLIDLEDAGKLLYINAEGDSSDILLSIENDDTDEITFHITPKQEKTTARCSAEGDLDKAKNEWSLFSDDFVYLYADREQPRGKYIMTSETRLDSRLGNRSASNAAFLMASEVNNNKDIRIPELKHESASDYTVLRNVSAWISYIMGGLVSLTAKETEKDKEARLEYSIFNKAGVEQQLSPLNMPFGHSYVLPIILAVLTAPSGSMILVENPESHLHPGAQLRMGEFLSLAAACGIQIIIETHSDHLMNGIRLSCRKGIISPEQVEMDLIGLDSDGYTHTRRPVQLNPDGTVKNLVPGFFDEWEKALTSLIS